MAGEILCVSNTQDAQEILKRIEREATYIYQTLTLSEENAANVLYINGLLIHRSVEEIPISYQVIFIICMKIVLLIILCFVFRLFVKK